MKKLSTLLTLVLTAGTLAACGNKADEEQPKDDMKTETVAPETDKDTDMKDMDNKDKEDGMDSEDQDDHDHDHDDDKGNDH